MSLDLGKILTNMDWGKTLQGVGSLAGAWGKYSIGKEQNKLIKKQFDHEIALDNRAIAKEDEAQATFDSASQAVFGTKKKKTSDTSYSDAYATPATSV